MLEEVGRRKRRSTRCLTGVPVRCLLGCSHACTGRAPSTLAVGDAADFDMGDLHSKRIYDLCVDVPVRPTRAYFAAPVSQGPQASKQARKYRPLRGGGARQGLIAGYVLQSAAPAGSSPWVYTGVSSSPYTVHLCLGVRGPGMAELCSVASRVARETQPSYLIEEEEDSLGLWGRIINHRRTPCLCVWV